MICGVCGARAVQVHHWLEKGWLKAEGVPREAREDDRNRALPVCWNCHSNHHAASHRIPRELLPQAVWTYAQELDATTDTEKFTLRLELDYPAREAEAA